jgi:hypothetical protein
MQNEQKGVVVRSCNFDELHKFRVRHVARRVAHRLHDLRKRGFFSFALKGEDVRHGEFWGCQGCHGKSCFAKAFEASVPRA